MLVTLDDKYVFSLDILAEIPNTNTNNVQLFQEVANNLSSQTLSSIKSLVARDQSASSLLQGFDNYSAATIWDMKNIMSNNSLKTIMSSCVSSLAAKARQSITSSTKNYQNLSVNLKESDFVEFVLQESIGLTLPMYRLSIMIHDKALLKYINNSTKLKIGFGSAGDSIVQFKANIFDVTPIDLEDKIQLVIHGYLDIPEYLTTSKRISYEGTSLQVLQQILPKYNLTLNTNISSTNDKMVWKQSNICPIEYFIELWKHAYIDNEHQICTSITSQGKFNFIDIQKARDNAKDFELLDKLFFKQDAYYANFGKLNNSKFVYEVASDSMFNLIVNDIGGLVKTKVSPMISGSKTTNYSILTPEMHKNWYSAEILNKTKLYNCINTNAWASTIEHWNAYNVTDVVNVKSINSQDVGKYLVIGKLVNIQQRNCSIYLQLGRETYSKSTGNMNV